MLISLISNGDLYKKKKEGIFVALNENHITANLNFFFLDLTGDVRSQFHDL